MAHFAEIDSNNIVQRVIVVHDSLEANGAQWCHDTFGGTWLQTSYNGRIRKNFAGIGFTYDPARDAFIPPQPYPSWTLDEQTCQWVPPVPMPTDGMYVWNESTLAWRQIGTP
jgi:hypothetical protein